MTAGTVFESPAFWVFNSAEKHGDKIAIDDRGVTVSYLELASRIKDQAVSLKAEGLKKGDRVATITGNSVDHTVLFFACALNGLVLCPLSWRLTPKEISDLLDRLKPATVFFEDEYASLAEEALNGATHETVVKELGVGITESEGGQDSNCDTCEHTNSDYKTSPDAEWPLELELLPDDPLLIIFTSGSEATPKGVILTHGNCYWNNLSLLAASELSEHDKALCVLPQFHVGGWNIYPLLALKQGATLVLERNFQAKRVIDLIEKKGVNVMMGVPTQYKMLSLDDSFYRTDMSKLRLAQVGGAQVSQELVDTWALKGVRLSPGYGLTEASPNVLFSEKQPAAGGMKPYEHVFVRLESKDGRNELVGELQVSGPGVFSGYLDDEAATDAAFTDDGWLKTGDIAEYDTHGGIHLVGRIKEIYISGGENVAPAEIEAALLQYDGVEDAAVVGMPDRVWGEVGCAFVQVTAELKHLRDTEIEQSLLSFVQKRLAPFKIPKKIIVLDTIPRIGIDKADRVSLKKIAQRLSEVAN